MNPDPRQIFAAHELFTDLNPIDLDTLAAGCDLVELEQGEYLFRGDDPAEYMYIMVRGGLEIILNSGPENGTRVGWVGSGGLVGEMRMLHQGGRLASARAVEPSRLVRISRQAYERAARANPCLVERMSGLIRTRIRKNQLAVSLAALLGRLDLDQLDYLMEVCRWKSLFRGEVLFRQGEVDFNLYLVVSGRFRVIGKTVSGRSRTVGEIGRGEPIGEMAVISREPRSATVAALRDSELVMIPAESFQDFLERFPKAALGLAASVVARLRRTIDRPVSPEFKGNMVILPLEDDLDLTDLAADLAQRLSVHGSVAYLDAREAQRGSGMLNCAGEGANPFELSLSAWLDRQEEAHDFLVFLAQPKEKEWIHRCLDRADLVLVAGKAGNQGRGRSLDRTTHKALKSMDCRKLLVLIHPDDEASPQGTWAKVTQHAPADHIHLRSGFEPDRGRLARTVSGQGVGLVLGGGGARGLAHLGVLRAMSELGLPVDWVGGCSMGAIIAAMVALDWPVERMIQAHRTAFIKKKPLSDYNIPRNALLKGKVLEKLLRETFGQIQVQETWIPFFCVSSDLNSGRLVVHREGELWRAVRASLSLPGVFPPVVRQQSLLVDGGLLNNLPVDVMQTRDGVSRIVAVDVAKEDGDGSGDTRMPGIMDILMRSMTLSGVHVRNRNIAQADLYLNPPTDKFGFMEFEALDSLVEAGYEYARRQLDPWLEAHPDFPRS